MVTNANAGQRLIARGKVEIQELNDLLADIVADGHRAREVIQGIRNMMRKSEGSRSLVQITEVIQDLLRIVRADAFERKVAISTEIDSTTGCVLANRVQLLQVLLNLTMNGFEAMTVIRPDARRLVICARRNGDGEILVSVRDTGPGFPAGMVDQFFEPFFRQKPREPEWDLPLRAASSRRMADRSREKIVTARARVYGSAGSKEDKSGAP
jgi:two-component system sensor kinase FixL